MQMRVIYGTPARTRPCVALLALLAVQIAAGYAQYAPGATEGSGDGNGASSNEHPYNDDIVSDLKTRIYLNDEFKTTPKYQLQKYAFKFDNGVLPEHCDLIYYGHCRSTLQCRICDRNRKALKESVNPDSLDLADFPQTFCQKMPKNLLSGDVDVCGKHGTGCCVPCKRCPKYAVFEEHRMAWEGSVDSVDCRVPRVCPSKRALQTHFPASLRRPLVVCVCARARVGACV